MFRDWFTIFYWLIILSVGGGGIHYAAKKMREMALIKVSQPWPSLKYDMKQNFDRDPFIVVKKNGHTYIVHEDRLRKKKLLRKSIF